MTMANDRISEASNPEFYIGATHNQSHGFLAGFIVGYLSRAVR
jgi:hypothetical protein